MLPYKAKLQLSVQITKQGKRFVAWASAFDLSTSGRTVKEAQLRFEEASQIFIDELIEAGTLNEVLSELGWKKSQQSWVAPKVVKEQTMNVTIPAMV